MTLDEFTEKHSLSDEFLDDLRIIDILDKLYLEFTEEQTIAMIKDYFKHADEIQNDIKETILKQLEKWGIEK